MDLLRIFLGKIGSFFKAYSNFPFSSLKMNLYLLSRCFSDFTWRAATNGYLGGNFHVFARTSQHSAHDSTYRIFVRNVEFSPVSLPKNSQKTPQHFASHRQWTCVLPYDSGKTLLVKLDLLSISNRRYTRL